MNILVIGDLVGEAAVKKLKEKLPVLKQKHEVDFVIVNAENAASGMGITQKIFSELKEMKIDAITMGNHTWGKKDIFEFIDDPILIRPANYSKGVMGKGYAIFERGTKKLAVVNLIGRTDIGVQSDNPFTAAEEIVEKIKAEVDYIIIDFHAEATAEKVAMKFFLDGKVTAIFGTHTHVQTADEEVTQKGTAYITDVGMTGTIESVIGMDVNVALKRFLTSMPERYKLAEGHQMINGCVIEINDENCRATDIYRIQEK